MCVYYVSMCNFYPTIYRMTGAPYSTFVNVPCLPACLYLEKIFTNNTPAIYTYVVMHHTYTFI